MTTNPYALGKLTSDGPTKWGEIHAAPRYNYSHVKGYSDDNLHELLPSWHESLDINMVLVEMCDCSLQAEVHQYQCQMACLKQLNCHGRCILLSLIFYFERHVTVGHFT